MDPQESANPYQPPRAGPAPQPVAAIHDIPDPASTGRRVVNCLLDATLAGGLVYAIEAAAATLGPTIEDIVSAGFLSTFIAYMIVYAFPEVVFQRTFGKLCTGTKVVDLDGGKPTFMQIMLRTGIRIIPFDGLSFVFSNGWHDEWSKTMVVMAKNPYADMA